MLGRAEARPYKALLLALGLLDGFPLGLLRLRVFGEHCGAGHFPGREIREARFHGLVVEGIGIELLVNPLCEAELANAVKVAGTGAVGQAIQRVQNRFVGRELGDGQAFKRGV